jgi:hypothetical protein
MATTECGYCLESFDFDEWGQFCKACLNLFCCNTCFLTHYEVGYHEKGAYIQDNIYRPLMGPYMYMNDGAGNWVPAQEIEEWGHWKRLIA